MADPLSIAASALAVAGAGSKLAKTLHTFIESVRKSERHLRLVADHVKLTSAVLDNIGSLLSEKEVQSLCKDSLLGTTNSALEGCKQAFDELRKYVDNLLKQDGNGKAKLGTFDKLTFLPFRQRELDALQANLERFKSALDLVLSVINLSVSIKSNKEASQIRELKLQVEYFIKAKKDAEDAVLAVSTPHSRSSEGLVDVHEQSQISPPSAPDAIINTQSTPQTTARSLEVADSLGDTHHHVAPSAFAKSITVKSVAVNNIATQAQDRAPEAVLPPAEHQRLNADRSLSRQLTEAVPVLRGRSIHGRHSVGNQSEDEILQHLEKCAAAVAELSKTIEDAAHRWQSFRRYERHGLTPAFLATHRAMKDLWKYEADIELSDDEISLGSSRHSRREIRSTQGSRRERTPPESLDRRTAHSALASAGVAGMAGAVAVRAYRRSPTRHGSRQRSRSGSRARSPFDEAAAEEAHLELPAEPRKKSFGDLARKVLTLGRSSRTRQQYSDGIVSGLQIAPSKYPASPGEHWRNPDLNQTKENYEPSSEGCGSGIEEQIVTGLDTSGKVPWVMRNEPAPQNDYQALETGREGFPAVDELLREWTVLNIPKIEP